ncbi:hypothetical protein TNCV_5023661 [Trichonephila clavipes]|nr:hypothetical protein TNCV_5023661 [Trichonephila clavipes]
MVWKFGEWVRSKGAIKKDVVILTVVQYYELCESASLRITIRAFSAALEIYCVVPSSIASARFDIAWVPFPPLAGCNGMLKGRRPLIPEERERERERDEEPEML